MSLQPEQKKNGLSGAVESSGPFEGQDGADDAATQTHLENILGRINTIMTEVSAQETLYEPAVTPYATPADNGEKITHSNPELPTDNYNPSHTFISNEKQHVAEPHAGVGPHSGVEPHSSVEPMDMLRPYSEALNEVRDYFNERHSLDPNDGLVNSQRSQSITEEVFQNNGQLNNGEFGAVPEVAPLSDRVLLWGDAPLETVEPGRVVESGGALDSLDSLDSVTSVSSVGTTSSLRPSSPLGAAAYPSFEGERPSAIGTDIGQQESIFSPIKFENPFASSQAGVEVLGPHDGSGQFNQLRVELVDRISQLEKVIGHHFNDRKDLATEAAQAAIHLTLQNLDDTSLGRRLSDIEASLLLFQKEQDRKNEETRENLRTIGSAVQKAETGIQKIPSEGPLSAVASDLVTSAPPTLPEQGAIPAELPEGVNSAGAFERAVSAEMQPQIAGNSKAENLQNTNKKEIHSGLTGRETEVADLQVTDLPQANVVKSNVVQETVPVSGPLPAGLLPESAPLPSVSLGNALESSLGSPIPDDFMIGDIQLPKPPKTGLEQKSPLNSEGAVKVSSLDKSGTVKSGHGGQEVEMQSIDELKNTLSDDANVRQFGKQDAGVSAGQNSDKTGLKTGELETDEFLKKSASLRDQFNRASIVSNDEDLRNMNRRGSSFVTIIVVVALLLAATGIAFRKDAKGLQDFIFKIGNAVGDFADSKKEARLKGNAVSGDGKVTDGVLPKSRRKSGDRLGSVGDAAALTELDVAITGNIAKDRRMSGLQDGFSELEAVSVGKGDKDDQRELLAAGLINPGLPPALIGPYSLRHAAAKGDLLAQYEVARRFSFGQGVPKDYVKAVKWYMLGASKGFAPSQYRLATYFERGRGVEKSLPRAKVWYQRAAKLGNVKAMHNLAVIHTALDKEDTDYKHAIYWFKQAANRNLADSQFNLAILYQNGVGLSKNLILSYKWFSLAARQGDLDAATRRDLLEKKLKKDQLLVASNLLRSWKPAKIDTKANNVGRVSSHLTSTMSHANESVTRSRALTAQILLRKLGYEMKDIDGSMNEQTLRAVRKFEKDQGLPITGKITLELIQLLNKASI